MLVCGCDVSSVALGVYFVNLVRPLGVCERGRSGCAEHIGMSKYGKGFVTHQAMVIHILKSLCERCSDSGCFGISHSFY